MRSSDPRPSPAPALRALAAEVRERADEIEQARRLPADLARKLAEQRVFALAVPARYGGQEAHPLEILETIEALSTADGAAGWCVMIGVTTGLLAASLPERWAREIYGSDPRVITGGVVAPSGSARAVEGGHRVSGRWTFGSGCQHSDWLVGGCTLTDGDGRESALDEAGSGKGSAGAPETRLMFFDSQQFEILDTWHSAGLRGTGSHDFRVRDAFVPEGRSVVLGGRPHVEGPLYQFPTLGLLALGVCAVSLGIARHAIDAFVELASAKVPTGSRRSLAARPLAQTRVAQAEAAVTSARALVRESVEQAWLEAGRGERLGQAIRARLRLAAVNATWQAVAAVDGVYHAAGGSAVYTSSALQRCFRDVHVTTQHLMVAEPMYEVCGRALFGVELPKGAL